MCLIVDKSKPIPRKNFKVYKVFQLSSNGDIVTPAQYTKVSKAGGKFEAVNPLSRTCTSMYGGKRIDGGAIHALVSKDNDLAKRWLGENSKNFIVECEVKRDDFIAWGTKGDVAVKALHIPATAFSNLDNVKKKENLKYYLNSLEANIKGAEGYISSVKNCISSIRAELAKL